uniref:Uncharacterized protein n=1 Tax=Cercocebus atys TaxID=9531 RepID=A0A2K5L2P6_CERAT
MAVRSLWAGRLRVQRLLASTAAWESKGWPLPFSTATQRTAGEDCRSEDPPEELGPSLAERTLRVKDLTLRYQRAVADFSVRTWWRWLTFWRRLQSAFLKNQSLRTKSSLWRRPSEGCCF